MSEAGTEAKETAESVPVLPKDSKQVLLEGHLAQIYGQWTESHPGQKPPLYLDPDGNPTWMNRKERRARAKLLRSRK